MQEIPLQATPSQVLNVVLGNQYCQINLYQKFENLFIDLQANGNEIISGVHCLDAVRCVREAYRGFIGNLVFFDLQGKEDPQYTGLGSRWVLCYLEASENV
jgi:hypothetical protein